MSSFRFLFLFCCLFVNCVFAKSDSDQERLKTFLFDVPWSKTVKKIEENLGFDHRFVAYLKNFQRVHFNIPGYEGACFLPGKFYETSYSIESDEDFKIKHDVCPVDDMTPKASFEIMKHPRERDAIEIYDDYRNRYFISAKYPETKVLNTMRYTSIPTKKYNFAISEIYQFETINPEGNTLRKTRVYIAQNPCYEFWISFDNNKNDSKLDSLFEKSVFETFRLGTNCVYFSYIDERFKGADSLAEIYIEHPLQLLMLEGSKKDKQMAAEFLQH